MNYLAIRTISKAVKIFVLLWFIHQTFDLPAQQMPKPKKLTDFSFMTGEWKGKGTYYSPQGVNEFDVHESVFYAADSTTLLVRGQGFDQQGVRHHDAIGVMYFESDQIQIHAFTKQGQNVIADVTKTGDMSFDWGFDLPNGGKIKYSVVFTENTWEESGMYITPDGNNSYPTVKMALTRQAD